MFCDSECRKSATSKIGRHVAVSLDWIDITLYRIRPPPIALVCDEEYPQLRVLMSPIAEKLKVQARD